MLDREPSSVNFQLPWQRRPRSSRRAPGCTERTPRASAAQEKRGPDRATMELILGKEASSCHSRATSCGAPPSPRPSCGSLRPTLEASEEAVAAVEGVAVVKRWPSNVDCRSSSNVYGLSRLKVCDGPPASRTSTLLCPTCGNLGLGSRRSPLARQPLGPLPGGIVAETSSCAVG